jgi:O-antigen/teichoic acid export membrane protein
MDDPHISGSATNKGSPPTVLSGRLVRNILWNCGGQIWGLSLALFTTPYIVHRLGTDAFGLLMTVGIVTNYFWFMDLGLGQATVKYVAEHAARKEWNEVNRIFWTSFLAYLVLGVAAAISIAGIAPLCVTHWFQIPAELQPTALIVFYLSAIGFIAGMINSAPASIPRAMQRFDIANKVNITAGTAQTLLTVAFLLVGCGVRAVVVGSVIITVLSLVINTIIAKQMLPQLTLPVWHFGTFRRLLRFGGLVTISGVVGPVLANLEKLILANRDSLSAVTYYTVPYNLASKVGIVSGSFSSALFPAFSSLHGAGDPDRVGRIVVRASHVIMLLIIPITIILFVYSEELLAVWMGSQFAHRSAATLRILTLAMFVNVMAYCPLAAVQALGRPDLPATFHIVELITHVPVTMWLVSVLGIEGAAMAWLIRVLMDTALLWWATIRLTGLNWRELITSLFFLRTSAISHANG